jgi:two-component system phosphate regulon response regulator PhoB
LNLSTERILIIEDDPGIHEMLRFSFAREGWTLVQAITGEEGLEILQHDGTDCVILDIMLPGMNGFKVLKKIREIESCRLIPIIMCTARGEETDIIAGLELGADDYVVKPYSLRVLGARIRAALRRKETIFREAADSQDPKTKNYFQYGELRIDIERHSALLGTVHIDLTATEFAILVQFMSHPDIVFTRQRLITAIRGHDYPVTDRSIDVQIMSLRKKLKEAGEMIETIRGIGYRFKTEQEI